MIFKHFLAFRLSNFLPKLSNFFFRRISSFIIKNYNERSAILASGLIDSGWCTYQFSELSWQTRWTDSKASA